MVDAAVEVGVGAEYVESERRDVSAFVPSTCGRLLDIGCGSGRFGAYLKSVRQIEVWGVEPHSERADSAEKVLDRVIRSFYDSSIELPSRYFDVITFNDSLEHFPHPEVALDLCKQHLGHGGVVICSLPNFRFIHNLEHIIFEADFRYEQQGIRDRTHLKFFTAKSMRRMFEECGYTINRQEGINPVWWGRGELWRRLMFRALPRWSEDMRYLQYVNVVSPRDAPGPGTPANAGFPR